MTITTNYSHIVTRLPTIICVMVPVRLQGKKPSKNIVVDPLEWVTE
jgi:hypothetical protein